MISQGMTREGQGETATIKEEDDQLQDKTTGIDQDQHTEVDQELGTAQGINMGERQTSTQYRREDIGQDQPVFTRSFQE